MIYKVYKPGDLLYVEVSMKKHIFGPEGLPIILPLMQHIFPQPIKGWALVLKKVMFRKIWTVGTLLKSKPSKSVLYMGRILYKDNETVSGYEVLMADKKYFLEDLCVENEK